LDSVPHDATVDMVPPAGAGEWWENLPPRVDLKNWATFVPEILPGALKLEEVKFTPPEISQGESTLLTARPVVDSSSIPNPLFQVFANFSRFKGDALTPMNDAGVNGDLVAGDGVYSVLLTIAPSELEGDATIMVHATELNSGERVTASAQLAITGQAELQPILSIEDAVGDDHGPNQPGERFLYYTYPTNGVFFPGVFDLQGMEVFDAGDKLVFRVKVGDVTDPSEPDASDWNATYPSDQLCPSGSRIDLNLQNVVLLIDNISGKGSTKIPDNRYADIARQDAWDYAVVADGWWKGMLRSNNSSAAGSWDIFRNDEDYFFCANAVDNTIDLFVDKSRLEVADLSAEELKAKIAQWDFIVLMSGHDGDSNDSNWGGIRWVNEGRPEWQFGGGKNGEQNRERDANIIDIMTHAGLDPTGKPKPPGRPQEEQLDFTTPEAERRFADPKILVSCELEAEELIDTVPPQITFLNDPNRALRQWAVLKEAPVSPIVKIEDVSGVTSATLKWRGVGEPRSNAREVPLGLLRSDLDSDGITHIGDIPWDEFSDPSVTNLVQRQKEDGTTEAVRYMILSFEAADGVGNKTPEGSVEYLIEVPEKPVDEVTQFLSPGDLPDDSNPVDFDLPEGSRLRLPRTYVDKLFAEDDSSRLSLRYRALGREDLDLSTHGGSNETVLMPQDRFLETARSLQLFWVHADSTMEEIKDLPELAEFSIHFPYYEIGGEKPSNLQYFRYSEPARRWILVGGHSEVSGSTITAKVAQTGLYGVFTKGSDLKSETLVTGLQLSPNPFSPNGDGIHDYLNISYVIPDEIDQAVVEI
ncbi:MAG TPA: glucodextranase DOMON-like domain-containing protein, partial [Candidatus Krumholzibacteria bacterium]|nr:glucodextranase DOMON-like domain-containing protein [Candidatus Krumholzibacteria bacterium]